MWGRAFLRFLLGLAPGGLKGASFGLLMPVQLPNTILISVGNLGLIRTNTCGAGQAAPMVTVATGDCERPRCRQRILQIRQTFPNFSTQTIAIALNDTAPFAYYERRKKHSLQRSGRQGDRSQSASSFDPSRSAARSILGCRRSCVNFSHILERVTPNQRAEGANFAF